MNTVIVATHCDNFPDEAASDGRRRGGVCLVERVSYVPTYQCAALSVNNLTELAQHECVRQSQVMVIDQALLAVASNVAICQIHQRMPEVAWMLGWDTPTHCGFEAAVRGQARGCIEWDSSTEHVAMALRAVLAGDLWFPRRFMQSLCFSVLAAVHADAFQAVSEELHNDGAIATEQWLTERELQTLGLMRQGLTNKEISNRLGISVSTVKKHLGHVFQKQGLHSRRQLRD